MTPNLQLNGLKGQQSQEQAREGREQSNLCHLFFSLKSGILERGCLFFLPGFLVYVCFLVRESECVCARMCAEEGESWREGTGTKFWR